MKDKVEEAIKEYEINYFYGQATLELNDKWNYSVFKRDTIDNSRTSSKLNYTLAVVRENYIPEELIEDIINSILSKTNLKLRDTNFKFDYIYNPKSSIVCEVITIDFYQSTKVCHESR